MEQKVRTNGLLAWVLASRPKTLTGAAAPVIIGGALAWRYVYENGGTFRWTAFVLCLLFAFVMQVDANFVNDYYDYKKGSDREDRLGPERACAQGWITPTAMKWGIGVATVLSCAVGLPLVLFGGWWLIAVGAICVIFCFLYTTCLSYRGYGDVLVLLFFGLVPVCLTFYVIVGSFSLTSLIMGLACGLATDCLLMVNNYRDRHQDAVSGKRTVVVRWGGRTALMLYRWLGLIASCLFYLSCAVVASASSGVFVLIYLTLHLKTAYLMEKLDGRELNAVLGATARNIFVFALVFALSIASTMLGGF